MLQEVLAALHGLREGLFVLLYFGPFMVLLSSDPNIKTCRLNSVFTAHYRDGFSCEPRSIDRGARGSQQFESDAM